MYPARAHGGDAGAITLGVKLTTRRLELVAATPELLRAELVGSARLAALLGVRAPEVWPPPLNSDETLRYALRFLEAGPERAGWMSWYFVLREPRILVGQGGYCGRPESGTVEVGYSVLEAHQRRGYATEAVRALVERAFAEPGVDTVIAHTLPGLAPSIRVLERLGFRLTGPGAEQGSIRYALQAPPPAR